MQKIFFLGNLLKRGSWSKKTSCQKFYNKNVVPLEETFQNAMLKIYEIKFPKYKKVKAAFYFKF